MSLPQTNVNVTLVRAPGQTDDYDEAATPGTMKWQGVEGAYLQERTERIQAGTDSRIVVSRVLITPIELPIDRGDSLIIQRPDGTPQVVTARAVARHELPGVPGTIRLQLDDE